MLSGQVQTWLARGLTDYELRPGWDKSGVYDAVAELAKDPRPPFELLIQALTQAANGRNDKPISITWPLPVEATVRRLPEPPRYDDEQCEIHGSSIKDAEGWFVCCAQEAREQRPLRPVPPAPASRRCGPPPAGLTYQELRAAKTREAMT